MGKLWWNMIDYSIICGGWRGLKVPWHRGGWGLLQTRGYSRVFKVCSSIALLYGRERRLIIDLRRPWHDSRQLQAQMVHFLRQLQAFCQLEVIECSWQSLMDFTDKREGDLDALIAAHRTYLDRVVRKVLLLGSKRDKQVSSVQHFVGVNWRGRRSY
jgi:hypothetical protein